MKDKLFKGVAIIVTFLALIGASTASFIFTYQPKTPKSLIK